jgi:hypothetical protein
MAEVIGEQIEAAILDRRNWLMGNPGSQLRVIESEQVSPLSLVVLTSRATTTAPASASSSTARLS